MTDAPTPHAEEEPYDESHDGPIRTPKQLILAVLWAHIIPIGGILLLVAFVVNQTRAPAGSDALTPAATAQRLQPVGHVVVRDASDTASLKTGEQAFAAQCTACHSAGVAGAPKLGDASAWAPRIAQGYDALVHSALAGKGAMPPQGGGDLGDLEIARAVVYMANKAGASFAEPKAPPAAQNTAATQADAGSEAASAAIASAKAAMSNMATAAKAAPAAAGPAAAGAIPALYNQVCQACHATGVAGAPKLGDKQAWAPRIALGLDELVAIAIKGKGAMPPRGGSSASDAEIKAVVTYMVNAAK